MTQLVFLSGKRTAFGSFGGSFKDINPTDLAVAAAKPALEQAGVKSDQIDHVICGSVAQTAPDSVYTPRHLGLKLGIPQSVPSVGINRLCGTGLQLIIEAYQQMCAGDGNIKLLAAVENMSMAPFIARKARWGMRMGHGELIDSLLESLFDTYANAAMGLTAENLSIKYNITRAEADAYAVESHRRAMHAAQNGYFSNEIVPFKNVSVDEGIKADTTIEKVSRLPTVFKKDGSVSIAASSGIVDGAAAMVVASEDETKKLNLKPIGKLISYSIIGCDPNLMGEGPIFAIPVVLKKAGLTLEQIDLFEINEAFSQVPLAAAKTLNIPLSKLNPDSGALAIGHPLATSGLRIIMHALYALKRQNKKYALCSACIGGGQSIAMIVEAV